MVPHLVFVQVPKEFFSVELGSLHIAYAYSATQFPCPLLVKVGRVRLDVKVNVQFLVQSQHQKSLDEFPCRRLVCWSVYVPLLCHQMVTDYSRVGYECADSYTVHERQGV